MLKVFLFLILLTSLPVNAEEKKYIARLEWCEHDAETLKGVLQWGIENEYLDPRESWMFEKELGRPNYLQACRLLRERLEDLQDAPPSCDFQRFPSTDTITAMLTFNKEYEKNLETQQAMDWNKNRYEKVLQETRYLHSIWSAILEYPSRMADDTRTPAQTEVRNGRNRQRELLCWAISSMCPSLAIP